MLSDGSGRHFTSQACFHEVGEECERWRLVVQKYHRGACGGNIEDRFATIQICRLARLRCPSAQFIDARAAEHYSLVGVDGGSGEPHDGCGGEAASRLDHYPR